MGRFSQIKNLQCKIKNEMIERILGNQDLLKYIYYQSSNPLSENDIESTTDLINTYVFKRSKSLLVEDKQQSMVFVKINSPSSNSGSLFKEIYIIFDIICHNSLIDNLDTGEDRSLSILDGIDDILDENPTSQFWMGSIKYKSFNEIFVNDSFSGYRLIYKVNI